jgi:hypothetical protein
MIKLKKNFLDDVTLKSFDEILGNNFGWYYKESSETGGDKDSYFLHTFFQNDQVNSSFFKLIEPVLFLLKVKKLILARINLFSKKNKIIKSGFHIDFPNCKTSILYLNTNNGYTEFENKKKIKSIKNNAVIFDSNLKHRAVYQTDEDLRIVLNINYEQ